MYFKKRNHKSVNGKSLNKLLVDMDIIIPEKDKKLHRSGSVMMVESYDSKNQLIPPRLNSKLKNDNIERKNLTFDEYKIEVNTIMKDYKFNNFGKKYSVVEDKLNYSIPEVSKFMKNFRNSNKSVDSSFVKTNAIAEEYKNPIESYIVLDHNKRIYENLINSVSFRHQQKYIEISNKIGINSCGKQPKRLKITSIIPKNVDLFVNVPENSNCK